MRARHGALAVLAAALTIALAAPVHAAVAPIDVPGQPTVIYGVRNTLPPLVATQSYAAGPGFAAQIEAFRASGQYQAEQAEVARAATRYLRTYLDRHCRTAAPGRTTCGARRAAAVFDIDDTLVSWYDLYAANQFSYSSQAANQALDCQTPVIAPVVAFYRAARRAGVTVFFVTGRHGVNRQQTVACLTSLGITGYRELVMRDPAQYAITAVAYKSAERRRIEREGYRIITAIGDQVSDSAGGATRRGFLLPNPMYFIP